MVSKFVFWSVVLLAIVATLARKPSGTTSSRISRDFTYWQGQYRDIASSLASSEDVKQARPLRPHRSQAGDGDTVPLIQQVGHAAAAR